jgi:S1-C subfamily serine protease
MNEDGEVIGIVNAKRREKNDLLDRVEKMTIGAISLHGVDLVEIYQAVIKNVQLGIGYAIPCSYIPEIVDTKKEEINNNETVKTDKKQ